MESQMLLSPVCCVFWTKVALFQHTFLINNQSSSGSVKALLILQETVANPPPVSDKLNKNSLAFRGKGEETFRGPICKCISPDQKSCFVNVCMKT